MRNKYTQLLVIAFVFLFVKAGFSQMGQGDKYSNNGEYAKAIPYYKKVTKSKDTNKQQEALIKIANLYKLTNQYNLAEESYAKLFEINPDQPKEVVFNYAQILKANHKYEEAAEQYTKYIQLSPNDETAKKALKFCREIKYYLSKPIEYTVKNIEIINTKKSEFSPFIKDNQMLFIGEKEQFDFVNYSVDDYSGQPFMNIYVSDMKGPEVEKQKLLSKKINSYYHDGPACLSSDGNTIYFTRVDYIEKKGYVNRSKIFVATRDGKNWKDIKEAEGLNSPNYSVAHPCLSPDNNTIFFTSDMAGGMGSKDIWMCQKEGGSWGIPVNLGPDINTTGDEMFPSMRKDGVLFFSSNGLPGFGGLDIYSAKLIQSKWILTRNEGMDLNSSTDDFGISFLNDTIGYFSSNRPGGKGNDDIYTYKFKSRSAVVEGNLLYTENKRDFAKGKKILLLDELGNVVDSTYTDAVGYFAFKNSDGDKKYLAEVVEDDPILMNKARFYLSEKDSVIHRVTSKFKDSKFVFRNLPVDPNALPDLYTEDDLVFAGLVKYGNTGAPLVNTKLKLVNEFGDVVEESTTNEYGAFGFRNIPSDQNYLIELEEGDVKLAEGTKIMLTNKNGKDVRTFYKGKSKFFFKVLVSDKSLLDDMDAEDVNLVMGVYGYMYDQDKNPIKDVKLKVKEEDGTNEQTWTTTAQGKFNFKNLDAEKNYMFETEENDPKLKDVKRIYIADSKGKIYKVIEMEGGKFAFKILEVDKFFIGDFVVEDPTLIAEEKKRQEELAKAAGKDPKTTGTSTAQPEPVEEEIDMTVTIVENIYYAYGAFAVSEDGKTVLDKAADAMKTYPRVLLEISSHTDSQSSAGFNLNLSKKRAQAAVDYLVKKGIARQRLKATGYGETRLLNGCGDGSTCTDEEHKVNRRTEFKITNPIKKK